MFCPVCKAEYRPGFTHCSDCDVDLVTYLPVQVPTNAPGQQAADLQNAPTDEHGNLLLWSGIDPRLYDAICNAFDASHIVHTDTDHEFGLPSLGQKVLLVWVNPRDWTTASAIAEQALKEPNIADSEDIRLRGDAARMDPFRFGKRVGPNDEWGSNWGSSDPFAASSLASRTEGSTEPAPDDIAAEYHPEDATEEVWSGKDPDMAETVRLCLRENGIGCVIEERNGAQAVLVTPESTTRAKEIVDEIVRGSPAS